MEVRVRFAPSPTGFLHVGGLRTALYNWLFARKHNGKIVLRLEDTDRSRYVENAEENLLSALKWAGIEFDEDFKKDGPYAPYVQSKRLDIYKEHAQTLIDNGTAYYAFDTPEELNKMREKLQEDKKDTKYTRDTMRNSFTLSSEDTKEILASGQQYVIRLKVNPEEEIVFNDIIRGEVRVLGADIDDQILMKSDGFPTYHLANVVDDYLMKITHVIRGEEWLPSTPKHILLYKSFGWTSPEFAHLPLLLNKDKTKLSKRQGSVAVEDFRAKGYLPSAFVNFVALLGWNPSGDREIYDINELIENFHLEKVNKGGAVFDIQKLDWMNTQYLKKAPIDDLALQLAVILKEKNIDYPSMNFLEKTVALFIERITFLSDIPENHPYMFNMPEEYDIDYMNKHWKEDSLKQMQELLYLFQNIDDFIHENAHNAAKNFVDENNIKFKDIIHPLRLIITGRSVGAGMFETMEALGKEECLLRLRTFIKKKENGYL